ncbi:MAG: hypothetical protein IPN34_05595 [Planctomycetes bacterium]|nr:hypothetical protein [Planctomycetota bacterium]
MRSIERIGHVARSFEEAERWDREQMLAMTPEERLTIARILRERVYGTDCPDVREAERQKQRESGAS